MQLTIPSIIGFAAVGAALPHGEKIWDAASLLPTDHEHPVSMQTMREMKIQTAERQAAAGAYNLDRYSAVQSATCTNGKASEDSCKNVDMMGFLRHQDMGLTVRAGNDVWGKFYSFKKGIILE